MSYWTPPLSRFMWVGRQLRCCGVGAIVRRRHVEFRVRAQQSVSYRSRKLIWRYIGTVTRIVAYATVSLSSGKKRHAEYSCFIWFIENGPNNISAWRHEVCRQEMTDLNIQKMGLRSGGGAEIAVIYNPGWVPDINFFAVANFPSLTKSRVENSKCSSMWNLGSKKSLSWKYLVLRTPRLDEGFQITKAYVTQVFSLYPTHLSKKGVN